MRAARKFDTKFDAELDVEFDSGNKVERLGLEAALREAMQLRAAEVSPPDDAGERLLTRICWEESKEQNYAGKIAIKEEKERKYMKRFSVKLVGVMCAVFVLSAMTVCAASSVLGGWVGGNIAGTRVANYQQMTEKLLPELDYSPRTVEEFTNGFEFVRGELGENQAMDDAGNRFGRVYKDLVLDYKNSDGVRLALYVGNEPAGDEIAPGVVATREVGDVLMEYREMQYLFVPPGYEVSEEDMAAEARGEMYISVGSSEVERQLNCGVQWTVDGVTYNLFGWDLELGAEAMLDMAEELLPQDGAEIE